MTRWAHISTALVLVLASTEAAAQAGPASPFLPGGPLAPWVGPLPEPRVAPPNIPPSQPPQPAPQLTAPQTAPPPAATQMPPMAGPVAFPATQPQSFGPSSYAPMPGSDGAFNSPAQPSYAYGPPPPPTDEPWKPVTRDADRKTYVAVTGNPALTVVGKTSGRLEIAPLAAHAAFVEVSRLSFFISELNRKITGTEIDVGYHLFPQGQGARGFYLGPRYLSGSGDIPEASWEFKGFGGDLGYQWVIAHHLVFNLGAGVARIEGKADLKEDAYDLPEGIDQEDLGAFSLSSQEESFWVPMLTLGLGLAI